MKRNSTSSTRGINIVCAVLMFALLICQFVPFWNLDGETSSIGGYVWFPDDHSTFTSHFQETLNDGDFYSGSIAGINVLIMLACVAGVVFCIKNLEDFWPVVFPVACGILGLYQYLAISVFRLGNNWGIHLVICIAMLVMAIVTFIVWIRDRKTA